LEDLGLGGRIIIREVIRLEFEDWIAVVHDNAQWDCCGQGNFVFCTWWEKGICYFQEYYAFKKRLKYHSHTFQLFQNKKVEIPISEPGMTENDG
jgi:hypothetical protein